MEEVIDKNQTHKYILTLIKYIYGILQAARFWFKEYIKTIIINAGLKICKHNPCPLYQVNVLITVILILYVKDTLEIRHKSELIHIIE